MTTTAPGSARPPAIVLLSGGLDSATCLAIATNEGFDPIALSFRYGQRHAIELEAASRIAGIAGAEHVVVDLDLGAFGGSALTDDAIEVPKRDSLDTDEHREGSGPCTGIPVTYVPARNTIFLSLALALAEVRSSSDVFIGVNALDYSGYPDCRPEFIEAFENMANLATRAAVEGHRTTIHTPLIELTKAEIIRRGLQLGVDHSLTTSCYDPAADGSPCTRCDSCLLRARGFAEAGLADPALRARRRLAST